MTRQAFIARETKETKVGVELNLDGSGITDIDTGVGFFDHLLSAAAHHALFDLKVKTTGDLVVDDHHSVEDTALALGEAVSEALGDREGITRFGQAQVPMDESLAQTALDISGRPYSVINLEFKFPNIGNLSTQNIAHSLEAFSRTAGVTLHINGYGRNDHHLAEAVFKSLGRALGQAVAIDPRRVGVASTKGKL